MYKSIFKLGCFILSTSLASTFSFQLFGQETPKQPEKLQPTMNDQLDIDKILRAVQVEAIGKLMNDPKATDLRKAYGSEDKIPTETHIFSARIEGDHVSLFWNPRLISFLGTEGYSRAKDHSQQVYETTSGTPTFYGTQRYYLARVITGGESEWMIVTPSSIIGDTDHESGKIYPFFAPLSAQEHAKLIKELEENSKNNNKEATAFLKALKSRDAIEYNRTAVLRIKPAVDNETGSMSTKLQEYSIEEFIDKAKSVSTAAKKHSLKYQMLPEGGASHTVSSAMAKGLSLEGNKPVGGQSINFQE